MLETDTDENFHLSVSYLSPNIINLTKNHFWARIRTQVSSSAAGMLKF